MDSVVVSFWLGTIGSVLVLTAYLLLTLKKVAEDSLSYQLLNAFGAAGLFVNTLVAGAYPTMGLNVVWCGIALVAIGRIFFRERV
ncbi:MAG: hypothetical protein WCP97_04505 [bacterium]